MYKRQPPLRERYEDMPILCKYFIEKYNKILGKNINGMTDSVKDFFMSYPWPGNVRELEHAIEGSMNITEGKEISSKSLPYYLQETYKKSRTKKPRADIKQMCIRDR